MRLRIAFTGILVSTLAVSNVSSAACVNRFIVNHTQTATQEVTLLTGKITYQEAQSHGKNPAALTWVDEKGIRIAPAVAIHVLRPMPVSCDGKPSGVVMTARFLSARPPAKVMLLKIGDDVAVPFEEQVD